MRLAMAQFGVNTAVVATVLTAFMLGFSLGSVFAGRSTERIESLFGINGLHVYAAAEGIVFAGGLGVPMLFHAAREKLLSLGAIESASYTLASAGLLAMSMLPFCVAMGWTFPAAMSFMRKWGREDFGARNSFSYLYLANVAGAVTGVLVSSLILIECLGFRMTLHAAAAINAAIVLLAVIVASNCKFPPKAAVRPSVERDMDVNPSTPRAGLFLTGLASMGMEVLWTRIYPIFVGTFVYSFAGILATYLISTAAGSFIYRRHLREGRAKNPWSLWGWMCVAAFLPVVTASVDLRMPGFLRIVLGIAPFCGILGYLTPALLDRSGGRPDQTGTAYGLNLLGGVIGPVLAGFVLIPHSGPKWAAAILAAPLFLFSLRKTVRAQIRLRDFAALAGLALFSLAALKTFDDYFPARQIKRDPTATVMAAGEGMRKRLYVNGISITHMTPITKMMAHFPMAFLAASSSGTPANRSGLVICMGMGTTFRSLSSWGCRSTVVELAPSVPEFFPFFFQDADTILSAGGGKNRIVIDDGRRFLDRSDESFDLITIDPPPPVEAAASSLLYSKEFYRSAARRLKPGGILATWIPPADRETLHAVARSLMESFPYVRVFGSVEGWGYHFLASMIPLPAVSAAGLLSAMPTGAVSDMTEWREDRGLEYFETMLGLEMNPGVLILRPDQARRVPALTDDRPVNEFFFVRRVLGPAGISPRPD